MDIQPDELGKKLTPEVRERILRDNWHSHDARWFLKVSQELFIGKKLMRDKFYSF